MSIGPSLATPCRGRFSIPDRSQRRPQQACGERLGPRVVPSPIGARALADELGEAGAEGPQRRAADLEADLGDREVPPPQQGHGPLDAPGHQVAVRGLPVGGPKAPREVAGRHAGGASHRLDVERASVLAIHLVSRAPQTYQVIAIHAHTIPPAADLRTGRGGQFPTTSRRIRPAAARAPAATSGLAGPRSNRRPWTTYRRTHAGRMPRAAAIPRASARPRPWVLLADADRTASGGRRSTVPGGPPRAASTSTTRCASSSSSS